MEQMRGWQHSGFGVHHAVRLDADDLAGRERLAHYMLRCPLGLERLILSHRAGQGDLPRREAIVPKISKAGEP